MTCFYAAIIVLFAAIPAPSYIGVQVFLQIIVSLIHTNLQ